MACPCSSFASSLQARPEETQLRQRGRAKTLLPSEAPHAAPRPALFRIMSTALGDRDVLALWSSHALAAAAAASKAKHGRGGRQQQQQGYEGEEAGGYGGDDGDDDDGGGGGGYDGGYADNDGGFDGGDCDPSVSAAAAAHQAVMEASAAAAAASGMLGPGGLLLGGVLMPAPRKVQRVEVSYDRVAKVVSANGQGAVMRSSRQGGQQRILGTREGQAGIMLANIAPWAAQECPPSTLQSPFLFSSGRRDACPLNDSPFPWDPPPSKRMCGWLHLPRFLETLPPPPPPLPGGCAVGCISLWFSCDLAPPTFPPPPPGGCAAAEGGHPHQHQGAVDAVG